MQFLNKSLGTLYLLLVLINSVYCSKLLFLLVDGFRWDYFNFPDITLNGFARLFKHGSRAEWLTPEFPTNSFPNYKTLETGLHVENHGVVGNYMFDEKTGKHFRLELDGPESYLPSWWDSAESFFITAEKQGIRTALYHVRGCHVPIHDIWPTHCLPYHTYVTREQTDSDLRDALEKIKNNQIDIAYLYHQHVDAMGHEFGPSSNQVRDAVLEVDTHINDILDIIEDNQQNDVNVIIVSDHGMSTIDTLHKINISEALNMNDILEITEGGTQAYVWPKSGKEKEVYNKLKNFHPNMKVYHRDDILDRWFFKKHTRIPPIFITVDKGWYLAHPKSGNLVFETTGYIWQGNHGFDNNDLDMRGIFAAYGPDFKSNQIVKGFDITNVYQIICKVTGIKPNPNNGTWSTVEKLLKDNFNKDEL
ncbi:hypothetical protein ACF0H5_011423 [Mactra antiquata]